jgi:hypothetical protein
MIEERRSASRNRLRQAWSDLFGDGPVHFVDHYSRNDLSGMAGASTVATTER